MQPTIKIFLINPSHINKIHNTRNIVWRWRELCKEIKHKEKASPVCLLYTVFFTVVKPGWAVFRMCAKYNRLDNLLDLEFIFKCRVLYTILLKHCKSPVAPSVQVLTLCAQYSNYFENTGCFKGRMSHPRMIPGNGATAFVRAFPKRTVYFGARVLVSSQPVLAHKACTPAPKRVLILNSEQSSVEMVSNLRCQLRCVIKPFREE